MIRSRLIAMCATAALGLAACSTTPSASPSAPATPADSASPTADPTTSPTPEPSPSASPTEAALEPIDLVLMVEDVPGQFQQTDESEITLESEEELYGPEEGPPRRAALESFGFMGGHSRTFEAADGSGELLGSQARVFETADGARDFLEAETQEYEVCSDETMDTPIGQASAAFVCAGPRGEADLVMFVEGDVVVNMLWSGVDDREATFKLITDLAKLLEERASGTGS
ncbi:MAG: hypothetical protein ACR2K4_05410 [Candidatus Limnocylindria bacterium]